MLVGLNKSVNALIRQSDNVAIVIIAHVYTSLNAQQTWQTFIHTNYTCSYITLTTHNNTPTDVFLTSML